MTTPSIQFADLVYDGGVPLDDPAERYHEASRLYPSTAGAQLAGAALVEADPVASATVLRSSRRHPHRDGVTLPPPRLGPARLEHVLEARVSRPAAVGAPLPLAQVASILGAAYGARATRYGIRRPSPSAGALYPLELYVLCARVDGAPEGLLHYDPFDHRLEQLDSRVRADDLRPALRDAAALDRAALVVVVTAMVWRSRFKYGLRGYRFALLEAGHATQNVLLACAALRLAVVPIGGFYDRAVDRVVGADGLDEVSLYVLPIGGEGSG